MKRYNRFVTLLGLSVIVIAVCAGVAHAADSSQVVEGTNDSSIYRAGSTVTITGTVNGDIFCVGQTVTINAEVNGDVMCAGQTVTVEGTINGNVRLAGQTITVGAKIAHGYSVAGQTVVLERTANVGQDATVGGQSVTLNGMVGRDFTGASKDLTINGQIGRNVQVYTNNLMFGRGALVSGNVTYSGPNTLKKKSGAKVTGTIVYHKQAIHRASWGSGIFARVFWLFAIIAFSIVLVALFPQIFRRWTPGWGPGFWWALLTGFIASFVIPALIFALLVTIIGIPLALFVLLLWVAAAFVSAALAAYFTGTLIAPKLHPVLIVLIGAAVLGVLEFLPIVGALIWFVSYWVGSGILLLNLRKHYMGAMSPTKS